MPDYYGRGQMTDSGGVNRPIGYWLRLVDSLLTERINTAQRRHSMTRVEWQILNVLREAAEPSASRKSCALLLRRTN